MTRGFFARVKKMAAKPPQKKPRGKRQKAPYGESDNNCVLFFKTSASLRERLGCALLKEASRQKAKTPYGESDNNCVLFFKKRRQASEKGSAAPHEKALRQKAPYGESASKCVLFFKNVGKPQIRILNGDRETMPQKGGRLAVSRKG